MPLEPNGLLSCLNVTSTILRTSKIQVMPKIDLTRAEVLNGMSSLVFCLVRTPILAQITTAILEKLNYIHIYWSVLKSWSYRSMVLVKVERNYPKLCFLVQSIPRRLSKEFQEQFHWQSLPFLHPFQQHISGKLISWSNSQLLSMLYTGLGHSCSKQHRPWKSIFEI